MLVLYIVIAVLAAVGIGLWGFGMLLPVAHSVTRSAVVPATPGKVWALITDFAAEPAWNRALKESRRIDDRDGNQVWLTVDRRGGKMPLETVEAVPETKLVRKIADPKLPFGGKWTITLAREGTATRVTVTEDGEVYNPFFRVGAKLFMNPAASMAQYLAGLKAHLGAGGGGAA
jgi:uncharacterized protein YndB with AHSA1/START domain